MYCFILKDLTNFVKGILIDDKQYTDGRKHNFSVIYIILLIFILKYKKQYFKHHCIDGWMDSCWFYYF